MEIFNLTFGKKHEVTKLDFFAGSLFLIGLYFVLPSVSVIITKFIFYTLITFLNEPDETLTYVYLFFTSQVLNFGRPILLVVCGFYFLKLTHSRLATIKVNDLLIQFAFAIGLGFPIFIKFINLPLMRSWEPIENLRDLLISELFFNRLNSYLIIILALGLFAYLGFFSKDFKEEKKA